MTSTRRMVVDYAVDPDSQPQGRVPSGSRSSLPGASRAAILSAWSFVASVVQTVTMATDLGPAQESFFEAGSLFESLLRYLGLGRAASKASDASLDRLMRFAIGEVGGVLLAAQSVDDLEDRLDEIIFGNKLYHINALTIDAVRGRAIDTSADASAAIGRVFVGVLEPIALASFQSNAKMFEVWLRAQMRLLQALDAPAQPPEMAGPWLLTDHRVPVEIAQVMADTLRASACLLALALAADDGRVIRPDIARALVSRLVAGAQSHLRLLAAIPQAEVPAGFVSAPLDLGQISVLHDLAERRVSKLVAALA